MAKNPYMENYNLTTRQLTAKAKELGIMSYPVIQRRAAAINEALGTKYSAKRILVQEINARTIGYGTTKDYADIMSVTRGKRADVGAGRGLGDDEARAYLQAEFRLFAAKQPQVKALIEGREGDYIGPRGEVYTPAPELGPSVYIDTRTGARIDGPPSHSAPWNPRLAIDAIHSLDSQLNEDRKNNPSSFNYEEVDYDVYI